MNRLTTSQVAERLGIGKSTVTLYCRQGRFPNAKEEDTPRGKLWWIPESDIKSFTPSQPGRPPKAQAANNGVKKAAKKGGKR